MGVGSIQRLLRKLLGLAGLSCCSYIGVSRNVVDYAGFCSISALFLEFIVGSCKLFIRHEGHQGKSFRQLAGRNSCNRHMYSDDRTAFKRKNTALDHALSEGTPPTAKKTSSIC